MLQGVSCAAARHAPKHTSTTAKARIRGFSDESVELTGPKVARGGTRTPDRTNCECPDGVADASGPTLPTLVKWAWAHKCGVARVDLRCHRRIIALGLGVMIEPGILARNVTRFLVAR